MEKQATQEIIGSFSLTKLGHKNIIALLDVVRKYGTIEEARSAIVCMDEFNSAVQISQQVTASNDAPEKEEIPPQGEPEEAVSAATEDIASEEKSEEVSPA